MLMPTLPPPLSLADEQGFSLIELLVAMVTATVVAGALFAVLNFSTTMTASLSDKVQSDQLGRTAMTKIVDELHSACLTTSFIPIQINSSETNLRFIAAYSGEAEIKQAEMHEIVWNKATGTLIDYHEKNTGGGSLGSFTYPEPSKAPTKENTSLLATNVTNIVEGETTVPIFQYFSYATETTESEKAPVSTLETKTLPGTKAGLSLAEAATAASVLISFNAIPADGKTTRNRSANFSNQVTFAFSVPNAETPIHDAPCQ
jgi:prepilin-type N-terminal cleavage/methylation domain-containing protein